MPVLAVPVYEIPLERFILVILIMVGLLVKAFWPESAKQKRDRNNPSHSVS